MAFFTAILFYEEVPMMAPILMLLAGLWAPGEGLLKQEEPQDQKIEKPPVESSFSLSRRDLWYGVPDVVPGRDMLHPLIDLIVHPSRLLDLTPRRVPSMAPAVGEPQLPADLRD